MTTTTTTSYVEEYLPPSIIEKLEAGAFKSLCSHLRERSDQVQNIDLMTISGFCRNCLAKWVVIEARKLSDSLKELSAMNDNNGMSVQDGVELDKILQSLDALGYDEAAQYIYGMDYDDWKKQYSKKASDEVMQKFNDSKPLWATHDKQVLAKRSETPGEKIIGTAVSGSSVAPVTSSSLLSNVCCQDVDGTTQSPLSPSSQQQMKSSRTRALPPFQPPNPPAISFSLGVLTVSDRASAGEYKTGDLSGPAVRDAVVRAVAGYGSSVKQVSTEMAIVPDDMAAIQSKLMEWAVSSKFNLILTTGGTGFSPRDVTPEATELVLERSCGGLVAFCTQECAKMQPLASLSRGTAGVRGKTLIVNLPGNPKGVEEIVPVLLPLALHAVADLRSNSK